MNIFPKKSLVIGRFNVPTLAHAHTLERAASANDGELAVGLITPNLWGLDYEPDEEAKRYLATSAEQHLKTTFSPEQRRNMLNLTLGDVGLGSAAIISIGRPEVSPGTFNRLLPVDQYELCFPSPKDSANSGFDAHRDEVLPRLLKRIARKVETDFTQHNSDIKSEAAKKGPAVWKKYMTSNTYTYFRDINGPERLN